MNKKTSMASKEREDIHDLFSKVREHPDFVGGTIFTADDIPEGRKLPDDWREKHLTDPLAERGNELLDDNCVPVMA